MNKYKFENGYVAEWRNRAINPGESAEFKIEWSPAVPDMLKLGHQFAGEYLYKFVPSMCQPISNRMKSVVPYSIEMPGCVVSVLFKADERPIYMAGGKEMLVLFSGKMDFDLFRHLSKN